MERLVQWLCSALSNHRARISIQGRSRPATREATGTSFSRPSLLLLGRLIRRCYHHLYSLASYTFHIIGSY